MCVGVGRGLVALLFTAVTVYTRVVEDAYVHLVATIMLYISCIGLGAWMGILSIYCVCSSIRQRINTY